jgi:hypothetical protein
MVQLDKNPIKVGKDGQTKKNNCTVKDGQGLAHWLDQDLNLTGYPDTTPTSDLANPVKRVAQE